MVGGESPGAGCDLWPLLSRTLEVPLSFVRFLTLIVVLGLPGFVRCSKLFFHH